MAAYQFDALQNAMMPGCQPKELPPDYLNSVVWMLREGMVIPRPLAEPLAQALIYVLSGQLKDARALFLVMRTGGRYRTAAERSWREVRDVLIAAAVASAPGTSLRAQAEHVLIAVNSADVVPGTTRDEQALRGAFGGSSDMPRSASQLVRIARGHSGTVPPARRAKKHR